MAEGGDAIARQDCGHDEVIEENNVVDELGSCGWKPKLGMPFDSAYDFYNNYGGKVGFSIKKSYAHKNKQTKEITSRTFVCYKDGSRGIDKRDPLVKFPRQEVRCGCGARLSIKLDRNLGKYVAIDFVEHYNHDLVREECIHMLPSRRKISTTQVIEVELASKSGIPLRSAYELLGRESGGRASLGFTKLDQKNYLRSKRQKDLEYGEAGSVLQYFCKKTVENPSFYYAVQLDYEEQITNMFWADAQMIMDYAQFGDVVTFDTTYKLNNKHRPFGTFVGFNHHRETVIFSAALMYDETAESFTWFFHIFLEAIPIVMPNTNHRLCTWHLMQNAVKHVSSLFGDVGVKGVFSKFMHEIDDEEEFRIPWDQMLDRYDPHNNHWLKQTFGVKDKWGWPYIMNSWAAGMSTTQLSESFNACLKDYINCDHNLMEFFTHFERVLYDKRYKELEAEYNLSQKLPKVFIPTLMLKKMVDIYTKTIFEEFQNEYVQSIEASIVGTRNDGESTIFTIRTMVDGKKDKNVIMDTHGSLSCSCKKFEVKGIVCRHYLKVLRDIFNAKDLPAQYILKRWTKKARVESVKDNRGYDVKADVKLNQSDRYRSLMNMFRAIASRASESEETYHLSLAKGEQLSVMVEDKLSVHTCGQVEVTALRNSSTNTCPQSDEGDGFCTPEGQFEPPVAMGNISSQGVYTAQGQSRPPFAMDSNYVEGVYTAQGQSRPAFAMGSNYVEGHGRAIYISQSQSQSRPESQSQPPFAMGRSSVHDVMYPTYDGNRTPQLMPPHSMPLVYPTHTSFQELLRGTTVQLSQASHSPADNHVDGHPWKPCTER
ncbi:protein FAR1-RELATED SEQUENCE 5-like [Camellia sinensis]|uniref:protein FAR1-RELATED SEQUENCE 5-like n=1 Tax=Camellia sinensis TaxID=4442 RepID=UPI0010367BDF|nr:protein FAR1-RELATED SEQUENCE 5-like [Camellia sinensis]